LQPRPEKLGDGHGYQHIEGVVGGRTEGDWSAAWERDGAKLTLRIKGAAGTEIFTGVAPGRDPAERVPVLVVRRRGLSAVFDVIHEFA
jgi:hypothetical protein